MLSLSPEGNGSHALSTVIFLPVSCLYKFASVLRRDCILELMIRLSDELKVISGLVFVTSSFINRAELRSM